MKSGLKKYRGGGGFLTTEYTEAGESILKDTEMEFGVFGVGAKRPFCVFCGKMGFRD